MPPQHEESVQLVPFVNVAKHAPSPETLHDSIEELKLLSQQLAADDDPLVLAYESTHYVEDSAQQSILTSEQKQRIAKSS